MCNRGLDLFNLDFFRVDRHFDKSVEVTQSQVSTELEVKCTSK